MWCSGWRLAAAVSNAGGLGVIGAGSMHPETLVEHIRKCKETTELPFGVNVPLLYPEMNKIIEIIIEEQVPVVVTSAGNPALWMAHLKNYGIKVGHVVSNTKFADKAAAAGVDFVVAEGFEAGGHNGREETTTMTLIPHVRETIAIPLVAAGGIASGQAMAAAIALGADGVQIGSLFAATEESSAHPLFKQKITEAREGDTLLLMKKTIPVRLLKGTFFNEVKEAEDRGADAQELKDLLGKGRAKAGIFEGDMETGELEIGQVSAMINEIKPVSEVMKTLIKEYNETLLRFRSL